MSQTNIKTEFHSKKKRIAVDMDEVIADALGEHITRYNRQYQKEMTREDLHGKNIREAVPFEISHEVESLVHTTEFFSELEVFPHAKEVLERLSRDYDIFIATAAMEVPLSFQSKYEWLLKHFPFISPMNFVFCGDKSIVDADYLIDDNARHFARFKGKGILFDAPHNKNVEGYPRANCWLDIEALIN